MVRIDAHHHLWHYNSAEYGWIDGSMQQLRRAFLARDLRREAYYAEVSATVVVQARQSLKETIWLLETAHHDSLIAGVVGWLPLSCPNFPALVEQYVQQPMLRGLRHVVLREHKGFLDGNAFNAGIGALRGSLLVYDIFISARQLEEATRFVDRHPEQAFVLDHIGSPDIRTGEIEIWSRDIRELARRPNVSCKLSGMVTAANPQLWDEEQLHPYFEIALEAFGAHRLMAATDWPVLTIGCSYSRWWQILERWTSRLSEDEQKSILGHTAQMLYRIDLSAMMTGANA